MDSRKEFAVELIKDKLDGNSFNTYIEIAKMTEYHPKYILKLKKEVLDGTIRLEHGNKNKKPHNELSEEEKEKIISLYKRANASVRKFYKFYGRRSYSCIYNLLKENDLLD